MNNNELGAFLFEDIMAVSKLQVNDFNVGFDINLKHGAILVFYKNKKKDETEVVEYVSKLREDLIERWSKSF